MTNEANFSEPVLLRNGGQITEIRNAIEACAALQTNWPEARGKWYYAASRACSSVAEGRTSPHVARRIFLQAAEESRVRA